MRNLPIYILFIIAAAFLGGVAFLLLNEGDSDAAPEVPQQQHVDGRTPSDGVFRANWVKVPSGKSVECVSWSHPNGGGGMDCDWDGAWR